MQEPLLLNEAAHKVEFNILEEATLLHSKSAFGDLSLTLSDTQACFHSKSRSVVGRLTRQDYLPVLKSALRDKARLHLDLVSALPFFKQFSLRSLERLSASARAASFCRKQSVYREGDAAENVYIVEEGEFELLKTGPKSSPEKLIKVKTLGEGEVFGTEEIIIGEDKREAEVRCVSVRGSLLIVSGSVLREAVAFDELGEAMGKRARERILAEDEQVAAVIKYTPAKNSERRFKKRKAVPLTREEMESIRQKMSRLHEKRIVRGYQRAMPGYKEGVSYRCYDSRIIRGEGSEPGPSSVLTSRRSSLQQLIPISPPTPRILPSSTPPHESRAEIAAKYSSSSPPMVERRDWCIIAASASRRTR